MGFHVHSLDNGLTVLTMREEHLHQVRFSLFVRGGAILEDDETQGVCHLLEHLCFRALGNYNHEALQLSLSRMGSQMDGATYPDAMVFTLRVLPRYFLEALSVIRRFFALHEYTEAEIAIEKEVVLRQIETFEEDLEDMSEGEMRRDENGYRPIMGTAESVMALDAATIRFWQERLFRPDNCCLAIAGRFTSETEQAALAVLREPQPADVEGFTDEQVQPVDFCMRDAMSDVLMTSDSDISQVLLAFDMDEEHIYPHMGELMSAFTAGNDDALLFQVLREEKALVDEIDSYIEHLGRFSRLVIRYDVRRSMLETSIREVFSLLGRLKMYVRPTRLELSRTQFTDNLLMLKDDPMEMCSRMGWGWIRGDVDLADSEAQIRMYNDLTIDDLQTAAQDLFRPENLSVMISHGTAEDADALKDLIAEMRGTL